MAEDRVGVGALDTGVDPGHPALRGQVARFLFVDENGHARPEVPAFDEDGHGTHTAALICGRGRGAIGVAPQAQLYCAAVIEDGRVPVRIIVGLEWLMRQPIRVLHMPLGIIGQTALLHDMLRRLRRRGVLPIAAIGNFGSGRFDTPACYPEVLSVGACDDAGEPAEFSGSRYAEGTARCLDPDVLAPGVDVRSAVPGGGWDENSGTSMASAYVAGVAARLFAAVPEATPSAVEAAIVRSARPVAAEFEHRARHGIVDADAALKLLRRGPGRRPPRSPIRWTEEPRCDPKLARALDLRLGSDVVEAIVLLRAEVQGEGAIAELVERHARAVRRRRYQLRVLPGGRAAVLVGHYRLMRALMRARGVAYLHSTELEVMGWRPW